MVLTRLTSKQLDWFVNFSRSVPLAQSPAPLQQPQPKRQHRLNAEQRQAVVQDYLAGASLAALARSYGVHRETISKILQEAGVATRVQRTISWEQITEAAVLYRQGWSLARLAEHYGFDGQTIRTHLVRSGVVMRGPQDWREL